MKGGWVLFTFCVISFSVCAAGKNEPANLVVRHPVRDVIEPYYDFIDGIFYHLQGHTVNITESCRVQTLSLLDLSYIGDKNAVKILDSIGKPLSGILNGGTSFLGYFSECLGSNVTDWENKFSFSGKYCLAKLQLSDYNSKTTVIPQVIWESFQHSFQKPAVGVCVPSACTTTDVYNAINQSLYEEFHSFSDEIPSCYEEYDFKKDTAAIFVMFVCLLLVAICVFATIVHIVSYHRIKNQSISTEAIITAGDQSAKSESYMFPFYLQCLFCFSLKKNASKLLSLSNGGDKSIDSLHGIRFFTMAMIILLHTYSFGMQGVFYRNAKQMLEAPTQFVSQIFGNATIIVDSFYLMSGMLVAYVGLKTMAKNNNRLNLLKFYLHRIIRLTPLLASVVAFSATLLRYVGSGPNWSSHILMYDEWCKKNWWLTITYLQNFINTDSMCLGYLWYLSTDFQFYLVTPPILILLSRRFLYGTIFVGVFFMLNVIITATLTVINHYPAIPYMNTQIPLELMNNYFKDVYVKPYCRMGPYLVGILAGYLFVKKPSLHLRKIYVVIAWVISISIMFYVLFITYASYTANTMTHAEAAAYSSFARTLWTLGVAWIIIACTYGYGGFVSKFLSWKAMIPFSRLTYCVYLIHPIFITVYYGSMEMESDFSYLNMICLYISNLVLSYMMAFILSMIFELPFPELENVIRKARSDTS